MDVPASSANNHRKVVETFSLHSGIETSVSLTEAPLSSLLR
jgi:hypothetical protein